jgi:thiol-disulfide isomerase/thioredoxin
MRLRSKIGVVLAIVALQGAILFAVLRVEHERERSEPSFAMERVEPRMAPALAWASVDGALGSLDDARGKVVVLHFWATWCPPCVVELPGLLELGREGHATVIAVSVDDDWDVVREFFAGEVPAEVVRASSDEVANAYGVSVLPETWIVDADGMVRLRVAGERDWRTHGARAVLREISEGSRR